MSQGCVVLAIETNSLINGIDICAIVLNVLMHFSLMNELTFLPIQVLNGNYNIIVTNDKWCYVMCLRIEMKY